MPKDLEQRVRELEKLWRNTDIPDDKFFMVVARHVESMLLQARIEEIERVIADMDVVGGEIYKNYLSDLKAEKQSLELK